MTLEAPLFLQAGTYPAEAVRALVAAAFHPGVCGAGELAVTQRGAGANMTVDVAAGTILIPGATSQRGVYLCRSTATASVTIGAAPGAGDSRIDLVVAQVRDAAYSGSDNDWRITVVAGTPDPSPTAPAVPSGALALATVLVEDDTTSITDAAVTDRRRYARPAAAVTTRPTTGAPGQVVTEPSGRVSVWDGATWAEMLPAAAIAFAQTELTDQGITTSEATWDTELAISTPGRPVLVEVDLYGNAYSGTPDEYISRWIEVSDDGGSTWPSEYRSRNLGAAVDDPDYVGEPVSGRAVRHVVHVLDPTGEIQVRVRGAMSGGTGDFTDGLLQAKVTPCPAP